MGRACDELWYSQWWWLRLYVGGCGLCAAMCVPGLVAYLFSGKWCRIGVACVQYMTWRSVCSRVTGVRYMPACVSCLAVTKLVTSPLAVRELLARNY